VGQWVQVQIEGCESEKLNLDFVVPDPVWNDKIEVWKVKKPNLDFVVPDRVWNDKIEG